jgi:hypothetical protein
METFQRVQTSTVKTHLNSAVACSSDFSTLMVGVGGQGLRVLETQRAKQKGSLGAAGLAAGGGGPPSPTVGAGAGRSRPGTPKGGASAAGGGGGGKGEFRVPGKAEVANATLQLDLKAVASSVAAASGGGLTFR